MSVMLNQRGFSPIILLVILGAILLSVGLLFFAPLLIFARNEFFVLQSIPIYPKNTKVSIPYYKTGFPEYDGSYAEKTFNSTASPEEVASFYNTELRRAGWVVYPDFPLSFNDTNRIGPTIEKKVHDQWHGLDIWSYGGKYVLSVSVFSLEERKEIESHRSDREKRIAALHQFSPSQFRDCRSVKAYTDSEYKIQTVISSPNVSWKEARGFECEGSLTERDIINAQLLHWILNPKISLFEASEVKKTLFDFSPPIYPKVYIDNQLKDSTKITDLNSGSHKFTVLLLVEDIARSIKSSENIQLELESLYLDVFQPNNYTLRSEEISNHVISMNTKLRTDPFNPLQVAKPSTVSGVIRTFVDYLNQPTIFIDVAAPRTPSTPGKSFEVPKDTKATLNGSSVKLSELKVGDSVEVLSQEGTNSVLAINATRH